jgi:hypothetical protein
MTQTADAFCRLQAKATILLGARTPFARQTQHEEKESRKKKRKKKKMEKRKKKTKTRGAQ